MSEKITLPIETRTLGAAIYHTEFLKRNLGYEHYGSWATEVREIDLDAVLYESKNDARGRVLVGLLDGLLIWLDLQEGSVWLSIAGPDKESALRLYLKMSKHFPVPPPVIEQIVPVLFWHHSAQGPVAHRRKLEVPRWDEIEGNYTPEAVENMRFMSSWTEPIGGKLMLWWGPPGTGKTYALRALAWEWREWCDLNFILDPDVMFGGATGDLMTIVMNDDRPGHNDRWKLLVLEDTGEMLTADAKRTVGQGLSRLLNLADGLIGQGLKIMLLVTTNEEITNLHPAVSRPGRAGCQIDFGALSRVHANQWLRNHGVNDSVQDDTMLADLFAKVNSWQQKKSILNRIGFRKVA
jgi:hypothetical protein